MFTIHLGANEIGLAYCVLASFVFSLDGELRGAHRVLPARSLK